MVDGRVGIDGHSGTLKFATMNGDTAPIPTRMTFMVPQPVPLKPQPAEAIRFLESYFAGVAVSIETMFAALAKLKSAKNVQSSYLKIGVSYPVKMVGGNTKKHMVAFECHVLRERLRSYISVSMNFPGKIATRITVDVSPETTLHVEEIVMVINEVYRPKQHKIMQLLVQDIGECLDGYGRVQDYLVLGYQRRKPGNIVAQRWRGVPGGMKPMPGLERLVPDI